MMELFSHLREHGRIRKYLLYWFWCRRRTIAYVVLVASIIAALFATQQAAIVREEHAQTVACQRVQVLRDQANGVSIIAYRAWIDGANREKALIAGDRKNAVRHEKSYKALLTQANQMVITGPTDCGQAVYNPDHYLPPAPEFIYTNSPRVRLAEARAQRIIDKARTHRPLYGN